MLETSKDVLYITLSFCIVFFTAFICWTIYYLGNLLKQSNEMLAEFRTKLEEVYETVNHIKENVSNSVNQIGNVAAGVTKIMEYLINRRKKSNRRR